MMWQFAPSMGGGGGTGDPTNLSYDAATRTLGSSTGTDVVLPLATGSLAGLMSASNFTALGTALQPGAAIPWTDVTGKPTTFPPSVHSHVASDVTDFNAAVAALITGKQNTLVSATNIKTVNGASILGSGDLVVSAGPAVRYNKNMTYRPGSGSTSLLGDGTLPQTVTGTITSSSVQTTNIYTMLPKIEARVGTAVATAIAGMRSTTGLVRVGRDAAAPGGFYYSCMWGPGGFSMPATHRALCGLLASTAAPTDVEPSTLISGIWMGWDAADTNVQIMHNDATGAATKIDLGSSFVVPTGTDFTVIYQLELTSPNSLTQSVDYKVTKYNSADLTVLATATGTITTNLPLVTVLLTNRVWCSVGGTSSAVGITLFGVDIALPY